MDDGDAVSGWIALFCIFATVIYLWLCSVVGLLHKRQEKQKDMHNEHDQRIQALERKLDGIK